MGRYALDMEKYADLARTASAEGCVLLKNDNSTLPLKSSFSRLTPRSMSSVCGGMRVIEK